jgi:hypothetical protein
MQLEIGGMADAIDHCFNGYLAKPYDTDDLAAGSLWGLHANNSSSSRICPSEKSRHSSTRSYRQVNTALYMKNFFASELKLDKTKPSLMRHPTLSTNRGKATLRTHLHRFLWMFPTWFRIHTLALMAEVALQ